MSGSLPVARADHVLDVPRFEQPDDVTCGPTCLTQVYRYYGDEAALDEVLTQTPRNPDGGTLAVYLGLSALRRGYRARIHSYNLRVFDPTWARLAPEELLDKLRRRADAVAKPKLQAATRAYAQFLEQGGEVAFPELSSELLVRILDRDHPILVGLSATHLYRQPRERPDDNREDDVGGEPVGHFVVVSGYRKSGARFLVRDPSRHVPFDRSGRYEVPAQRLLNSILLGVVTYDAVLLEVWPARRRRS